VPTPQDALHAAIEAWNAGDLESYLELYDERIQLHGYSPEPMAKPDVRRFYEQVFAAFDGPKLEIHEAHWDGAACALRFTMTGRHVAEFMGIPGTTLKIALPGITILHFAGDRVVERFSQTDMLGLLMQIGAVPAPA
jgi:predicted ester cyclase